MTRHIQLSELVSLIHETIEDRFYTDAFWITAEITDVKKYESKRWCFLKLIEKRGPQIAAEMQAVFWSKAYQHIQHFERSARRTFSDGLQVGLLVAVRFHERYGLKLEVLEIDSSYALGQLEAERQQTLDRLLLENPQTIQLVDDEYITFNKQLKLPRVVQRVALVTAPNSDGQRDFKQELQHNPYGYHFVVFEFLTQLQGDTASKQMVNTLKEIYSRSPDFDVVVIVRGGGSQTDFKPFDDFELCRQIALFPIPVFTGIGHDRNTSIADLMARQLKTPTKVAAALADINFRFENDVLLLKERMDDAVQSMLMDKQQRLTRWEERLTMLVPQKLALKKSRLSDWRTYLDAGMLRRLEKAQDQLQVLNGRLENETQRFINTQKQKLNNTTRLLHQLSPQTVINRGFAMVMLDGNIVTSSTALQNGEMITTIMKDGALTSTINKIAHEQPDI